MRQLFITGGAGFIGSEFVRVLLNETSDVKIVNFDALTYAGNLENIAGIDGSRHTFIKGNICDKQAVLEAIPFEADGLINFAAETHVDRSITSANEFITTNVLGIQVLLDCARERNVKRFLQISTDEVMGSLSEHTNDLFTEDSPFKPNSPYAASKAAAEHLVRAAHKTHGSDTLITRCGNNYGYRQVPEKLIPMAITKALNNESIPIYGDGRNVRDWIFVTDHCRAIWKVFEQGKNNDIYNIGAGNARENIDVVKDILDLLRKPHSLIKFVQDRPGHDRRYEIDASKIKSKLNWKAETNWKKGLQITVDWYLQKRV